MPNCYVRGGRPGFMELRDQASSSRTLGFRIQGMKEGHLAFGSKDFSGQPAGLKIQG